MLHQSVTDLEGVGWDLHLNLGGNPPNPHLHSRLAWQISLCREASEEKVGFLQTHQNCIYLDGLTCHQIPNFGGFQKHFQHAPKSSLFCRVQGAAVAASSTSRVHGDVKVPPVVLLKNDQKAASWQTSRNCGWSNGNHSGFRIK